jgi:hypothetical protein
MYAADYRAVGGLDLHISGWGGEDVDLYKKHVLSPLKVTYHTYSRNPAF